MFFKQNRSKSDDAATDARDLSKSAKEAGAKTAPEIIQQAFRLEFQHPLKTARFELSQREGIILRYRDRDGVEAFGEIAPLPGFSLESLEECRGVLEGLRIGEIQALRDLGELETVMTALCVEQSLPPALRFGLETLILDYSAKRKSLPLFRFLGGEQSCLPVNILVSGEAHDIAGRIRERRALESQTVKVKLPKASWQELVAFVETVFESLEHQGPLRFDLNASLPLEEALRFLKGIEKFSTNIEYIEDPLQDPSPEGFARLANNTTLPLAIDEIPAGLSALDFLESAGVLILKPALNGGVIASSSLAKKAQERNLPVIFTSLLESGFGVAATAHLAACFGSPDRAHGLDTERLLKGSLLASVSPLQSGRWNFDEGKPGLGVQAREPWL